MVLTVRPMYADERGTFGIDVKRLVRDTPCQDITGDFRYINTS